MNKNSLVKRFGIGPSRLLNIREKVSLLGAMSNAQVATFSEYLTLKKFYEGETIFHYGDQPSDIYIVYSGQAEQSFGHPDDINTIAALRCGDCFGESAVLGIQNQASRVQAKSDVTVLCLSGDSLAELFEKDMELFSFLMMNIAREVSRHFHSALTKEEEDKQIA